MISLKTFVSAIQDAIVQASDSLCSRSISVFDSYFKEEPSTVVQAETNSTTNDSRNTNLVPKTIVLEYQTLVNDEKVEGGKRVVTNEVHVPLITLIPLAFPRIERATLTAEFEMKIVNGEVQLDFAKPGHRWNGLFSARRENPVCKLEITMTPQETPEGLKLVVQAYEGSLKQQLS